MPRHAIAKPSAAPVALFKVEEARAMLARCVRVDEAKSIRDKAEAIRAYLRTQGASRDAQNDAAEIKLRAERRLGELLAEQKAKGERANHGKPIAKRSQAATITEPPPTLRDLGIEKSQASRWQDVAKIPEEKFEAYYGTRDARNFGWTTQGTPVPIPVVLDAIRDALLVRWSATSEPACPQSPLGAPPCPSTPNP